MCRWGANLCESHRPSPKRPRAAVWNVGVGLQSPASIPDGVFVVEALQFAAIAVRL
jgi:hypothetical protein